MMVVALIGILIAIAYPSFAQVLIRSDRADARRALLDVQMAQERFRSTTKYDTDDNPLPATYAPALADLATAGLSPILVGGNSERGLYAIAITLGTANRGGFTATATAQGKQAKDVAACRTIALAVSLGGLSKTPSECW
jgi:type IV pilus assembly protein PilE